MAAVLFLGRLLAFVVLAPAVLLGGRANPTVTLEQIAQELPDPTGHLRLRDVTASNAPFVAAAQLPPVAEGIRPRIFWFRLRLDGARSQHAWALTYSYKVTRIDVFVPAQGTQPIRSGGFDLARHDGALTPGVLLLPPVALRKSLLYLRVASVIDPRSISIEPLRAVTTVALQRRVTFGFFCGFYLTIAVFFLLMFVGLREWPLLNYAIVMGLEAFDLIISFGTLWGLLPSITFLQRELIFDGIFMLARVLLAVFAIGFLRLWKRDSLACGIVIAGTIIAFSTIVVDFTPDAPADFAVTLVANLAFLAALLVASIRAQRSQGRSARYFTAAVACFIAGYVINMTSALLPNPQLTVFADQAGDLVGSFLLALALSGEVKIAETLAAHDGLTGVANRRSFDRALLDAVLNASKGYLSLGLILVDIDRFKLFNDTFGHVAGDACLVEVAKTCAACVREGDVFARYGGEEFAAILSRTTHEELQRVAERMCAAVTALEIASGNGGMLTISVGGTTAHAARNLEAADLIRAADANLYSAKRAGRARVVVV